MRHNRASGLQAFGVASPPERLQEPELA